LGVILRERHDVFASHYRGFYRLRNLAETASRGDVGRAIQALKCLQEEKQRIGELNALQQEVQELRKRNGVLERQLAEIAEICDPLTDVVKEVP